MGPATRPMSPATRPLGRTAQTRMGQQGMTQRPTARDHISPPRTARGRMIRQGRDRRETARAAIGQTRIGRQTGGQSKLSSPIR